VRSIPRAHVGKDHSLPVAKPANVSRHTRTARPREKDLTAALWLPGVDVLRDLRKAGWIVLEVWVAEPGNRGHARRRYSAAQAYCTESGREAEPGNRGHAS
jgi:hypothetical protein